MGCRNINKCNDIIDIKYSVMDLDKDKSDKKMEDQNVKN